MDFYDRHQLTFNTPYPMLFPFNDLFILKKKDNISLRIRQLRAKSSLILIWKMALEKIVLMKHKSWIAIKRIYWPGMKALQGLLNYDQ